jgi:hypothetical protein
VTLRSLLPLYRREGMTTAAFRDHYERVHARIGERAMGAYVLRYARHYLNPLGDPPPGAPDVITEVVWRDRAALDACIASITGTPLGDEVAEDEARLFDRTRIHIYTVETCESDFSHSASDGGETSVDG